MSLTVKSNYSGNFCAFGCRLILEMEYEHENRCVPTKKKLELAKAKGKSWEEKEDISLIIEVLKRTHMLFGEIRGSGVKSIQRKRQDSWQDVSPKFFFVALRAPPF